MIADLGSLSLGSLTLEPEFDDAVTGYSTTTTNESDDLTFTLACDTAQAVVKLNGTEVEASEGVYTLTWTEDTDEVTITVTDRGFERTETKTYTIEVTGPVTAAEDADTDNDSAISRTELEAMTVAQLKQLATLLGVTLTATRKTDIIDELLGENESIEVPEESGTEE